ncbi:AAA family ATPase [Streptomyces sp. NPDC054796]
MTTYDDRANLSDLSTTAERVRRSVESVIEGKPEVVRLSLTVLLAEGHLLIEDVPGVGKTMLAKALARSIDCSVRRIQFTPDLLPSDITGVSVFDQQRKDFEFKPGAIFAQIVIGDEINRASPKTQSALLESMEERQVTIDGQTYTLPDPFMVVATQNPVEMEGTYPLPEAQRDRFMARVSIGYPSPAAELEMLDVHGGASPLDDLQPVAHAHEITKLIDAVRHVHVADPVRRYAVELVSATRSHPDLRLGASPRATLHLVRAARASAALSGREYALPDDVQALAVPVLAHRLLPTAQAQLNRRTAEQVVAEIVQRVPVPSAVAPGPGPGPGIAPGGPPPQAVAPGGAPGAAIPAPPDGYRQQQPRSY